MFIAIGFWLFTVKRFPKPAAAGKVNVTEGNVEAVAKNSEAAATDPEAQTNLTTGETAAGNSAMQPDLPQNDTQAI